MRKSPFEPCIPTKATKVPDRPEWIHDIKHDGYRLIVQREGKRVRLFARNGHDWSNRYPLITEAAPRNSKRIVRDRWRGWCCWASTVGQTSTTSFTPARMVRAAMVAAIDQQIADAGCTRFAEGDLLFVGRHGCRASSRGHRVPAANHQHRVPLLEGPASQRPATRRAASSMCFAGDAHASAGKSRPRCLPGRSGIGASNNRCLLINQQWFSN